MGHGSLIDGLKPEDRRANAFAEEGFPNWEIRMPTHLTTCVPISKVLNGDMVVKEKKAYLPYSCAGLV